MNTTNLDNLWAELKNTPQKAHLLAVTKQVNLADTNEIIKYGINKIGENRIESMLDKYHNLLPVEKHFIGVIQTKKIPKIVELFDVIESVSSLEHLQKINEIAINKNKSIQVFLQINIANEDQKSGFNLDKLDQLSQINYHNYVVPITGIMAIASNTNDEEIIRTQFALAKNIFDHLQKNIPTIKELSLGMSNDYKIALEFGSTLVRIGSLLVTGH